MRVINLGLTDFLEAYNFQLDTLKKLSLGECEDTLILTEHASCITMGRRASRKNILKSEEFLFSKDIKLFEIDRGGDVTYHGPGQIIAYPVFRLEEESKDLCRFLCFLEEIGSNFLSQYGLTSDRKPGLRGVWVEDKKIGSIGIGARKWITYHGLALNINTDLTPFSFIRPCGIESSKITSLKTLLGREVDLDEAKHKLITSFKEIPFLAEAISRN